MFSDFGLTVDWAEGGGGGRQVTSPSQVTAGET